MRESCYVVVSHKNTPVMNHAKQISTFDNTKQTNLLIFSMVSKNRTHFINKN